MTKIAIIGAGLSGLSAAHLLKQHADITVFEKARGVGGRMSTRRAEPYFFDHGAQYFTVRAKPFQAFIQPLIDQHIIQTWQTRYVKFFGDQLIESQNDDDQQSRYVGVPGMNSIAKHLAQDTAIYINTRIARLEQQDKWQLTDEQGNEYNDFDWVICTAPAPQAVELLPKTFAYYDELKAVKMRACFSLMLGFDTPLPLDFESAHLTHSDLSWIAVNSHKPGRDEPYTLMVHSSAAYADAHFYADRDMVMDHLISETSRILGHDVSLAQYKTVHGWLYANNATQPESAVFLDTKQQLAACGDWCLGGRVEGAFMAAFNLVTKLKEVGL